jgi:hypothetical protein
MGEGIEFDTDTLEKIRMELDCANRYGGIPLYYAFWWKGKIV